MRLVGYPKNAKSMPLDSRIPASSTACCPAGAEVTLLFPL
jgi:hypothetical protein